MAINNNSGSDELSKMLGMLKTLTLEVQKDGGQAGSTQASMLVEELSSELDKLKEEMKTKDEHLQQVVVENYEMREHIAYLEQLATEKRKPVCVRCWMTRRECDLGPRCQKCIDAGEDCERKGCDADPCHASRCPRVHWEEYEDEQQNWWITEGRLPHMDHRGTGRRDREAGY